jgi:hypothetical protein
MAIPAGSDFGNPAPNNKAGSTVSRKPPLAKLVLLRLLRRLPASRGPGTLLPWRRWPIQSWRDTLVAGLDMVEFPLATIGNDVPACMPASRHHASKSQRAPRELDICCALQLLPGDLRFRVWCRSVRSECTMIVVNVI